MTDPRFIGLTADFERLIAEVGQRFAAVSRARGGRVFHLKATTLSGWLEVLAPLDLEPHSFFDPGRRLPVILRHANGMYDDDAAPDNRGATLRVLDPAGPAELDRPLLDLLLTTGARFTHASAADFAQWLAATPAERERLVRAQPEIGAIAWDMLRTADSYTRLHYYTKVASHFVGRSGARLFARYRLLPPDRPAESGFVDSGGRLLPPERVVRSPSDERAADFLHADLRDRIARSGIEYLLQIQLHPVPEDSLERDALLDCTQLWSEEVSPFRDLARLHFDGMVAPEEIEPLRFNPFHAPPELAMVLANSPGEAASLNHLRSFVYDLSAAARTNTPRLAQAKHDRPQRVCIVGGGASGLYAARALERLGHQVTVLERDATVGGKCATLEVDGHRYDWGGHLCSDRYTVLSALIAELGVIVEPATPPVIYDLEARHAVEPPDETSGLRACFARYLRMRAAGFPQAHTPGLRRMASALSAPVGDWLRINRLEELGKAISVGYTASGYGFLQDPELAAVYVIKMFETAGFDPASNGDRFWTVKGGFGRLWERVAEQLRDMRCGTYPVSVVRGSTGVRVNTNHGELEADWLIIATPLPQSLSFLDATLEERDLFSRVRTLDYYTTACVAHGLPESGFYLIKQRCEHRESVGHPVAFHHRYQGSNVYLFYSYGDAGIDRAAIVQGIEEDVARMGGRLDGVIDQRRWSYFPHFASLDVADGRYEQLEQLQGRNRTYFLGSIFNFELIECNVAYAQALVARAFGATATSAPEAASREGGTLDASIGDARLLRGAHLTLKLQEFVRDLLSLAELPAPDTAFVDLGLDSVRAMDMARQLTGSLGRELSPSLFFDCPTIGELAMYLADDVETLSAPEQTAPSYVPGAAPRKTVEVSRPINPAASAARAEPASAETSKSMKPTPVYRATMNQDALWRAHCAIPGSHVHAFALRICERVDGKRLEQSLRSLIDRHPILRTTFHPSAEGLLARVHERIPMDITEQDASAWSDAELTQHLEVAAETPIDLARGPLVECELWHRSMSESVLVIRQHHTAFDAWSLQRTVNDLFEYYAAEGKFEESPACPKQPEDDFQHYARWEQARLGSPLFESQRRYWHDYLRFGIPRISLPVDRAEQQPRSYVVRCETEVIPQDLTQRLKELGTAQNATLYAVLLSSFQTLLHFESRQDVIVIGTAVLLRAHPAHSELVGPVFNVLPLMADFSADPQLSLVIKESMKASLLAKSHQEYPIGHLMKSFEVYGENSEARFTLPVMFTFYKDTGREVGAAELAVEHIPIRKRIRYNDYYLFATLKGGEISLSLWYAADIINRERARRLLDDYVKLLHGIVSEQHEPVSKLRRMLRQVEPRRATSNSFPHAEEALPPGTVAWAERLASRWLPPRHGLIGSLAEYSLCLRARAVSPSRSLDQPAVPKSLRVLDLMRSMQHPDGGVGERSLHPYPNLVKTLAFVNTLIRWAACLGADAEEETRRAVTFAVREASRLLGPPFRGNDGSFRIIDSSLYGGGALLAHECEVLFAGKEGPLSQVQRNVLHELLLRSGADYDRTNRPGTGLFMIGVEPTASTTTLLAIERMLTAEVDEPLPFLGAEYCFSLLYLAKAGADVKRLFSRQLEYLCSQLRPEGLSATESTTTPDCDMTAVALIVLHVLGLSAAMSTDSLERFWSEEHRCYQAIDGSYQYSPCVMLHVLDAYLTDSNVSQERRQVVWRRALAALHQRQWDSQHHLSPLYVLEKVISILAVHGSSSPEDVTPLYADALDALVAFQDRASGGFHSEWTAEPNEEETALALIALKNALASPFLPERRGQLTEIAQRARAFLSPRAARPSSGGSDRYPALWKVRLLYAPLNVIRSIVVAALQDLNDRPFAQQMKVSR